MNVTLYIVAYNEQKSLPRLFDDILSQTYPKSKTEILLIDNGSTDSTLSLMEKFKENKGYLNINVLKMKKDNLATACNLAFEKFIGDICIRVDAHASIENNFIEENVKCIESGENVCGGYRPCIIENNDNYHKTLLIAEESMFGSSFAKYRRKNDEKCYLDSLFHIALRREVIKKVGGYNEILGRTEDNEFNRRLRKNGYKLCYDPKIISHEYIRNDFKKMLKQKYGNGYWIGLTLGICRDCFSIFHFAPLFLVLSLLISLGFACFGFVLPIIALLSVYLSGILFISALSFVKAENKNLTLLLLPFIFIALHMAYGIGTLFGIVIMPYFVTNPKKDYKKRINEIKSLV